MTRFVPDDLEVPYSLRRTPIDARGVIESDAPDSLSHGRLERLLRGAQDAAMLRHRLALLDIEAQHRLAWHRSHFDPNQPRVPAGHPDGGQWTSGGSGTARMRLANGGGNPGTSSPELVLSDVSPDRLGVWSQYAQNETDPSSPDPAIERSRQVLHDILAQVNASVSASLVGRRDPVSPRLYGVLVHAEFARIVRARNLPGIGSAGVEQSFDPDGLARYGLDASIRTDVILRNAKGEIIAIYDVKTGAATIGPVREAKIRTFTRVGRDVPVIIMRAIRPSGPR
jgi:hypothetical protein